ncbi:MAG: PilZ domain-containing protein [Candidatus Xenobia bacterium]
MQRLSEVESEGRDRHAERHPATGQGEAIAHAPSPQPLKPGADLRAGERLHVRHLMRQLEALFTKPIKALPPQKRNLMRLPCNCPVTCHIGNKDLAGTVLDMSMSGMRIEVRTYVKPGTLLTVKYVNTQGRRFDVETLHTRVVWCSRRRFERTLQIGVNYTDTEDVLQRSFVKPMLRDIGFDAEKVRERRKSIRLPSAIRCEVVRQGMPIEGVAVNLSHGGMLVELEAPVGCGPVVGRLGPYGAIPCLEARSRALKCVRRADTGRWYLNLCFDPLDGVAKALLERYLCEVMRVGPH